MMYIVAQKESKPEDQYYILKIRLATSKEYEGTLDDLVVDDGRAYSLEALRVLIAAIHNGNIAYFNEHYLTHRTGGLSRVTNAKAILGFVRFTQYYYLVYATELKPEGMIMGHVIYSIAVCHKMNLESVHP